ncbi:MAG: diacylglycerol kinase family lipid kinase [Gemmatimonadota bacterium]|nr:MAG: diacylglycerol kinase family lipid kinase [Gemmatimonadota bacterium]
MVFNKRALGARALGRSGMAEGLRELGITHEIVDAEGPEGARAAATAAAEAGYVAVAAGGDGTALDVANGLLAAGTPDPTMGLVPLGTGNDLARALGRVGVGLRQALDALAEFEVRPIDVPQVKGGEYFLNVLGVGFDAEVARRRSTHRIRWPGYFPGVAKTILDYRPQDYRLTWPEGGREGTALMIAVMNGICEGGGFRLAPHASLEDGLLDIYWIDRISLWQFARYVWAVRWGTHERLPVVQRWQMSRFTVESDSLIRYHLDGEYRELAAGEPLDVVVHPRRLRVIV